jgi:hypothetical protein
VLIIHLTLLEVRCVIVHLCVMIKNLSSTFALCLIGLFLHGQSASIMTWNALNFSTGAEERVVHFQTVLDSLQPDILVVQELQGTVGANYFHSAVIGSTMAMAPFVDGYSTDNALYYDEDEFEAVENIPILTDLRNISQFVLVHQLSGDTLRVFSVHLKASPGTTNQNRRLDEVNALRLVTDALPPNSHYIVMGDFNFYSANEPGYQRLLEDDGEGFFIDPISITGTWNNANYAEYHTQSPRLTAFGGGASSGMDDRFDLILFSPNFITANDVAYVPNSTWAVGNDGLHYDNSVNAMPNASVSQSIADALYFAADHLPVVASIEFLNTLSEISFPHIKAPKVYPNPSSGTVTINLPIHLTSTLTVMDAMGRIVVNGQGAGAYSLDLNHLTNGVYYLRVTSAGYERVVRLMVL